MSDPPDDPEPSETSRPDNGLPEGITLDTTSGVSVLRVSFDGDEERALMDALEAKKNKKDPPARTTVLRDPRTDTLVEIIGTAHVSALAARQTRELIMRTKPDVVVLELDPVRLRSMLRDAQLKLPARHLAESNVKTHYDAFKVLWQGRAVQVVGGLAYAAVGAVLGSAPGAEFLAAIDAAKEVDARIVLGDLDARTTTARLFARTRWRTALKKADETSRRLRLRRETPPETPDAHERNDTTETNATRETIERSSGVPDRPASGGFFASERRRLAEREELTTQKVKRVPVKILYPDGIERPAPVPTPREAVRLMIDAGCDAPRAERGAWHLAMHADPDPRDLLAVRACAERVVELVRSEAYLERSGGFEGAARDTHRGEEGSSGLGGGSTVSGPAEDARESSSSRSSYDGGWAMDQTLRADRDLVLAHSLRRFPPDAKRVVGVVGAAHVPGITREWDAVTTSDSRERFEEALRATPEECTLEGVRKKFGRDSVGWFDPPGRFETSVAGLWGVGLLALSRYSRTSTDPTSASSVVSENAARASSTPSSLGRFSSSPGGVGFFGRLSSRANRFAWFGLAVSLGATLAGAGAATHGMVELGKFAAKVERAALAAEASGMVPVKRNELRSKRWLKTNAFGNVSRFVFVDAVNAATPYRPSEE